MIKIPSLKKMSAEDLKDKRIVARFDFNVPISGGHVADDFRLKEALPTLEFLKHKKAKTVLIAHLEDVYSKEGGASSLKPVYEYLSQYLPIEFASNIAEAKEMQKNLAPGHFILVENLRFNLGEKENDERFAMELSELGELYLNESFSVSHRSHASVVGIPKYVPGVVGPLFEKEVVNLSRALSPEHPFVFILGGAKFETKIPLIEKYLSLADHVVVAGALANDFFKAKGYEIGNSSVYGKIDISELLDHPKIILPIDVGVWTSEGVVYRKPEEVRTTDKIQDIGPESLELLKPIINAAKFILWNGPLGNYEMGFRDKTVELARMISEAPGFSVVGGGDTTAVIARAGLENGFDFISTGGGAMLEFLEKGTLPGIEALKGDLS